LFSRKKLAADPVKTMKRVIIKYIKSLIFMGSFVASLKYMLCKTKNFRGKVDGILQTPTPTPPPKKIFN